MIRKIFGRKRRMQPPDSLKGIVETNMSYSYVMPRHTEVGGHVSTFNEHEDSIGWGGPEAVSYTHLTLPTNREV